MRETLVALLMLGAVAAASAYAQQRNCVAPVFAVSEPSAMDGEDTWTGESAVFQNAIWRLQR